MTKEVRDFFTDNFEALIKAIKNDSKMWTFIPTLGEWKNYGYLIGSTTQCKLQIS